MSADLSHLHPWQCNCLRWHNAGRALPAVSRLYTQLYREGAWSVVFEFDEGYSPCEQNSPVTLADRVFFLVEAAPHHLLHAGFAFPFMDGAREIGICTVEEA